MIENEILNPDLGNVNFDNMYKEDVYKKGRVLVDTKLDELFKSLRVESPTPGTVVRGVYKGSTSDHYVFSVDNFKDDVRVDIKPGETKYITNCEVGSDVDVLVTNINQKEFLIKGSIASIYESMAHENLKSLEEGESVTAYVRALNPAGYDVEITNEGVTLQGFMPNTLAGINKLYDPASIIGDTFQVMIESITDSHSDYEGTYIVSRRKYLQSLIPEAVGALESGTLYTGNVTGTTPFGIFVEFNECLTGMIHKVNVNPEWQDRIHEIKPGHSIEFYVKDVFNKKIILSQVLRESLWDNIAENQIVSGSVIDVKPFGVLVSLDEETMGLIPNVEAGKRTFTKGQPIEVRVLSVDRNNRKIALSIFDEKKEKEDLNALSNKLSTKS